MSEQILEEMRERLEQKGAFDIFKKKKKDDFETATIMETKISMLRQRTEEREKEPFLEIEPADHILSDVESRALAQFFTKKEIDDLVNKKYQMIKTNLPIRSILIKLSEIGQMPKKPLRMVSCLKCGMTKEFTIDMCSFWELQKKYYCENCKKEIEALNNSKTKQIPIYSDDI